MVAVSPAVGCSALRGRRCRTASHADLSDAKEEFPQNDDQIVIDHDVSRIVTCPRGLQGVVSVAWQCRGQAVRIAQPVAAFAVVLPNLCDLSKLLLA